MLALLVDAGNNLAPSSPTLPTSVGVAVACAYLVTFFKKLQQVPWINFYSVKMNAIVRAATSFVSTIGVSVSWSSDTRTLTIGNITVAVIVSGLYHWIVQYGVQHGFESLFQSMAISTYRAQAENMPPKAALTPGP